jgi:hypothetical protein
MSATSFVLRRIYLFTYLFIYLVLVELSSLLLRPLLSALNDDDDDDDWGVVAGMNDRQGKLK